MCSGWPCCSRSLGRLLSRGLCPLGKSVTVRRDSYPIDPKQEVITMPETLTPGQKEQARESARAKRKAQEDERRARVKTVKAQLEKAELDPETQLDEEQRKRAFESATKKAGLGKKALAVFILEGKDGAAQNKEVAEKQAAAKKAAKTRSNITKSGDPEASKLAVDAKALAPEVKSAFLPKDARVFLDTFKVVKKGQKITVTRKGVDPVEFKTAALTAFSRKGDKDKDVRAALSTLGHGTRLWGRKLGLMILVAAGTKR